MAHASRNWKAVEATDLIGSSCTLTVVGEVQTNQSNETVKVTESVPQGISPVALLLTASIVTTGEVGAQVMGWRVVSFERTIESGQFREVTIGGDVSSETIKVEKIRS